MPGHIPCRAGPAGAGRNGDSSDRTRARGPRSLSGLALRLSSTSAAVLATAHAALAQQAGGGLVAATDMTTRGVIQFAVFAGVTGAAMLSAIWLIRERGRTEVQNNHLRERVAELDAAVQRADALLNVRDHRAVLWMKGRTRPELIGALPPGSGAPEDRAAFLAFGRWLEARSAAALEHALASLRERDEPFELAVETQTGALLEAVGRMSGAHRILRFSALTAAERGMARARIEHERLRQEHDTLRSLLDALPMPAWMRSPEGRLQWVNAAYAAAVEAPSPALAVAEAREFLGTAARDAIASRHGAARIFAEDLSTVVAGDRRIYSVTDVASPDGSAGIGLDVSDADAVRAEYARTVQSHSETLDKLNTAVAIFDAERKLQFYNQAFQKLWELEPAFLDSHPEHALVLDRLRSAGKLAEQPEWRRWKENLLSAYQAVEPQEHLWHLPDGRTLRVVGNPQPRGGATWVFENLTEKFDLESRYNTAVRVQTETLDNLAEGVAVFGPDGQVRLSNPAFATLWGIDAALVRPGTHITTLRSLCHNKAADSPWPQFVAAATGFDDERRDGHGQSELNDGAVLRYAIIHLPNGQVMFTFVDVTDSVNVERALKDKNEALQRADQLKNEFVQHVSYELRSPLTNIIGFTELLAQDRTGPLNQRQREYVEHIGSSSAVLLTIVNDILDLATVDAGIMELEVGEVPVGQAMEAAAELVRERLREHGIRLALDASQAPESFHADGQRVRQILFNLLSNAANYAPSGSTIDMVARRGSDGWVEFAVHDDGPGMSQDVLETVFRRFESRANGGRRRGAGLGLTIVKSFVELHGGTVSIDTGAGSGTTVTCRFPASPAGFRAAAE